MGKKYVDASAEYTEPVSSGKKHMRGDAVWVAPDTDHKFADAEAEWTVPEMYPPTSFPTETINTPEKLKQALIAVSQGNLPVTDASDYDYPVDIEIETTYPKFDDYEPEEATFTLKIIGFNNYRPNSITALISNIGNDGPNNCFGMRTLHAVHKGLYKLEEQQGTKGKVNRKSLFSFNNGKYNAVMVNCSEDFKDVDFVNDNLWSPAAKEFENVISKAKDTGWAKYFKEFEKSYSITTAVCDASLGFCGSANDTTLPGLVYPSSCSSTSKSSKSYTRKFHFTDACDSISYNDLMNTLPTLIDEYSKDDSKFESTSIPMLKYILPKMYSEDMFTNHQISDVTLRYILSQTSNNTRNDWLKGLYTSPLLGSLGGSTEYNSGEDMCTLLRNQIYFQFSNISFLCGLNAYKTIPACPEVHSYDISADSYSIRTVPGSTGYNYSSGTDQYLGSMYSDCYGMMCVLGL